MEKTKVVLFSIIQTNAIGKETVIASKVDKHYCIEITSYLTTLHTQFAYTYRQPK